MRRLQRHDQDGLERLLADHGARVRSVLRRQFAALLDDLQVDDAMSQATQRVWRAANRVDLQRGSLGAWFLAIARNCARRILEQLRRRRGEPLDGATPMAPEPPPEPSGPQLQRLAEVRRAIHGLQPQQRAVLLADLAAGGIASAAELAQQLGTTTNSVYVSRSNGRRALREILRGSDPPGDGRQEAQS